MTAKDDFNRQVRLTALLTVGLLAALIFGIIVLAGGDGIPGTIIVAASLIGLARQIPVINKLCRHAPPSPPHGKADRLTPHGRTPYRPGIGPRSAPPAAACPGRVPPRPSPAWRSSWREGRVRRRSEPEPARPPGGAELLLLGGVLARRVASLRRCCGAAEEVHFDPADQPVPELGVADAPPSVRRR
jgi:hypothetical protein